MRVVVLTGNGDAFSAGGDVNWMKANVDEPEQFQTTMREGEKLIRDPDHRVVTWVADGQIEVRHFCSADCRGEWDDGERP